MPINVFYDVKGFSLDFIDTRLTFLMDLNDEDGIWDSVLLEPLTEETFISNLNCRYDSNTNYVSNITL